MSSRHAGLQKMEISLYINLRNKESCCCLTWQPRNQLLGTETVELFLQHHGHAGEMLLFITASWFSKCFKQNLLSFGLRCGFVSGLKKSEATFSKTFIYTNVMRDVPCSVLFSFQVRLQRWVWEVQTLSHNHLVTRGCGLQVYSSLQVSLHFFTFNQVFWIQMCWISSWFIWTNCQRPGDGCRLYLGFE